MITSSTDLTPAGTVRHHLEVLEAERATAHLAGLDSNAEYMDDLHAEITGYRIALRASRSPRSPPFVASCRAASRAEPPRRIPAMLVGIITGSGTHALPGFEGAAPEPDRHAAGAPRT